jgi:ABC-type lipoprotein export system ATPase subunit
VFDPRGGLAAVSKSPRALVEARDVWKEFPQPGQPVIALREIDLSVQPGEFLVLTGESGSGKSTLLSLLGAIDRPSRGEVWFRGESLKEASSARLTQIRSEHVGFVFQDFLLVRHLPVLDNVRLPLLFSESGSGGDGVMALLRRVGLEHRLGHRADALSRGEMQRVALARALINRPGVLFADEPTANLDRRNSEVVWTILHALNHEDGLTVVVATHSVGLVREASRVIRLDEGRIASA